MTSFKTIAIMSALIACSSSLNANAQSQPITRTQVFEKEGALGVNKDDLYVFCQDKARQMSGYLGYVPGEYSGPNLLEESFNRNRQGGVYDIQLPGFKGQPRKAGTIGAKVVLSFGRKQSSTAGKKKRQRRRDFRKNLDGCILSKR